MKETPGFILACASQLSTLNNSTRIIHKFAFLYGRILTILFKCLNTIYVSFKKFIFQSMHGQSSCSATVERWICAQKAECYFIKQYVFLLLTRRRNKPLVPRVADKFVGSDFLFARIQFKFFDQDSCMGCMGHFDSFFGLRTPNAQKWYVFRVINYLISG